MADKDPVAELHPQFSSPDATPTPWTEALKHLEQAEVFWLSTVRPDGRPHVTPLLAVWQDDALYFCTGEYERKAKNLAHNMHCILTTGCNALNEEGLDLVSEVQVLGPQGSRPAREGDDLNNVGFIFFSDPDGNGWAVQQITSRS